MSPNHDVEASDMTWNEQPLTFTVDGVDLTAILHRAEPASTRAMLLIVGGPQYRVGSHRQFVEFARAMAASGTSVLRFDYRGMGDSAGPYLDFEQVEADVLAALDTLQSELPNTTHTSVFGLCDAASTALMVAAFDSRVSELVLLNPWVRSEATEAKAVVKHYYGKRFLSGEFWKKLLRGQVNVMASLVDVVKKIKLSRQVSPVATTYVDFREHMLRGAQHFSGRVLLILSGNDFTANEFEDWVAQSADWREAVANWTHSRVAEANHTFSRSDWKQQVVEDVRSWLAVDDEV
ncbi:MAG: hydrolase 1, exosortase A system-associated [Pseudomonadota bacterium]